MEGDTSGIYTESQLSMPSFSRELSDAEKNKSDTTEKKAVHLKLALERDTKAADLKWSLFVAAAHSFRHDSVLKPFPYGFVRDGIKDFDELLKVINTVPPLDLLMRQLNDLDSLMNIVAVIDLVHFVLVYLNDPILRSIPDDLQNEVLEKVPSLSSAAKPQHIVELLPSERAQSKWQTIKDGRPSFYAYHGSRLENMHSIIHTGLHSHLNKTSAFGEGTYLSSELAVALPYSQGGFGWGASLFSGQLACVLMCEIIDSASGLKRHRDTTQGGPESAPNSYFIVSNNEIIRVRYILVYATGGIPRSSPSAMALRESCIRRFLSNHKTTTVLVGYGIMLATIGLVNNETIQEYVRDILYRFNYYY